MEGSPAGSWRLRLLGALATGPFRGAVLRLYASASDHTRRLTSVRANSKFLAPGSGPDSALSVRRLMLPCCSTVCWFPPLSELLGALSLSLQAASTHADPDGAALSSAPPPLPSLPPPQSTKEDLRWVVRSLKERYGVRYVFAWHAAQGFWGGVGGGDPEVARYCPRMVLPTPTPGILEIDPSVAWNPPVLAGLSFPPDPSALHRDMHAYLAAAGVDGVKVDVQGTVGLAGSGAGGGPALAATYHASLEASARAHFPGNHFINW